MSDNEIRQMVFETLRILKNIFHLSQTGEYEEVSRSSFFPDLDIALLLKYIDYSDQYDAVNSFTEAIRNN
jgi:hypothetical protein